MSGPNAAKFDLLESLNTFPEPLATTLTKRRLQLLLPARKTAAVASLRQHCLTVTRVGHAVTLTAAHTARQ